MNELALRYGNALYSLALDFDKVELWQKEIKELIKLFKENPEFLELLNSDFLTISKRKEIFNNTIVFDDIELTNFINIIIDNGRVSNLLEILSSFSSLCNQNLGVIEGIVYSVEPILDAELNSLVDVISKKEGIKVELRNVIDKSLIGGLKVLINDHVYDGSIKNHLEKIKNTLMK